MKNAHKRTDRLAALRIVAIYAVVAALWIYLSDTALALFTSDPAVLLPYRRIQRPPLHCRHRFAPVSSYLPLYQEIQTGT